MRLCLVALALASITGSVAVSAAELPPPTEAVSSRPLQMHLARSAQEEPAATLGEGSADSASAYATRAQASAEKQDCEHAVTNFSHAIALAPREAAYYLGRAACLRILGRTDAAADDLTLALRIDRNSAAAYKLRARVRLAQGRTNEALTDLRWASGLDPRDISLMQMLGYARFAAGDYSVAADNLSRSLRFRDDMRAMLMLYIARGQSWSNWGGKRAELEKHAGYLRTRAWPFPVIALYLGHGSAKDVLERATTETERCEANFYVGYFLQVQGRAAEGSNLLRAALRACPNTMLEYETISAKLHKTRF